MGWDHLVISGDLTQLALPEEFAKARMALRPLLQNQERVSIVPGNHDYYVSETEESDYFRSYFGSFFGKNEIHTRRLNQDWHLIGWHSATPTPWYSASWLCPASNAKGHRRVPATTSGRYAVCSGQPLPNQLPRQGTRHETRVVELGAGPVLAEQSATDSTIPAWTHSS
jgi:3',5'-cyclic AMP phosphodiesterase CpdA